MGADVHICQPGTHILFPRYFFRATPNGRFSIYGESRPLGRGIDVVHTNRTEDAVCDEPDLAGLYHFFLSYAVHNVPSVPMLTWESTSNKVV